MQNKPLTGEKCRPLTMRPMLELVQLGVGHMKMLWTLGKVLLGEISPGQVNLDKGQVRSVYAMSMFRLGLCRIG
jgi:hypothetical protein